ncbi:MAG TPA: phosphohistidine phosphatase SixA [Gemmatimonadaceae bacterium]|nr:phosphohistidine phosphatase SixA [Gemmatimonadaceae bacterium]
MPLADFESVTVELLVIRHGVAEEREAFAATGKDDALRPLTKEGRWKMERVARGLRHVLPSLDVVATSPFTRAAQTAKIVAASYPDVAVERLDALTPEARPRTFLAWLRERAADDRVAIVGHEPHLGSLVYWFLTGDFAEGRITLRKGGACLLSFDAKPQAGKGVLISSLTPSLLRRLGE